MMRVFQFLASIFLSGLLIAASRADDLDIFYSPPNAFNREAMVMLGIDWRPNLWSPLCNGDCQDINDFFGSYLQCSDGTCNLVRRYEAFVAALRLVIDELTGDGPTGLRFGIMFNHDHQSTGSICTGYSPGNNPANKCSNGGYILLGLTDVDDPVQRAQFFSKLGAVPAPQGNDSHFFQGSELYFELFRYLTGQGIYNGHNGWRDFGTDDTYNIDDILDVTSGGSQYTPPGIMGWDSTIESSGNYVSPLTNAAECTKVFAINVMHQVSQQDSDSDNAISETKDNEGFGTSASTDFTSVIEYLHDANLADGSFNSNVDLPTNINVTSYFLVDPTKINTTTNGYASAGGTGSALSFSDDPQELVDTLRKILQEILGVSTTFVTTAVAANTLNRAQTREDLYIALFEPNEQQGPFWVGNVKKLKIKTFNVPVVDENGQPVLDSNGDPVTEEEIKVVDVNDADAINPLDGRIKKEALTFWTDATSLPAPPAGGDPNYSTGTDGREVSRGGAGQKIPGYIPSADPGFINSGGRKVFIEPATFTNGTAVDLMALDADNATSINLLENSQDLYETVIGCSACTYTGEPDSAKKTEAEDKVLNMIKFARGYDVPFDTGNYTNPDGRAWWIGDPIHSQPLLLNYGERGTFNQGTPDIRIINAGNDGVLHMYRDTDPDGSHSGEETWAFLPRDFMPLQKRFMEDSFGLYNPGIPSSNGPQLSSHPYGLDGTATALVFDNDFDGTIESAENDKVYVYVCMRRGGKGCYALDLTDPDQPKLLWTLMSGDPGFEELGQTWSLPRAELVSFVNASSQIEVAPALFVGGGYNGDDDSDRDGDLGKDSRVANANANTEILGTDDYEGNAVYIIDARDGSLIWKAVGPSNASDNGDGWDSSALAFEVSTLNDSIPASVTLFDSDGDGVTDRFYVPDTGGNLWRGDVVPGPRSAWTLTKVLELGRHYSADNANDRRFFARVDLARAIEPDESQAEAGDPFDAVVLISGDRAHPLGESVENWAYMFKDRNIVSGAPPSSALTHDDLQDLTNNCLQDGNNSDCTDLDTLTNSLPKIANGWKIRLNHCEDLSESNTCGEKGLSRPLIINRTVFFNSYLPPAPNLDTCAPKEGSGLLYAVSLFDATALFDFDLSNNSSDVTYDRFDTLSNPGIPPASVALSPNLLLRPDLSPLPVPGASNAPTFWYERSLK